MAVPSVAAFKAAYPAFGNAPDALVQAKLDEAALRTSTAAWGTGDLHTMGVSLRAADLLAKTPEGRRMRLVQNDGKSIFHDDLRALVRRVAMGLGRVTGGDGTT